MTASDVAAWWGAALATLVLGWDVYKWKTSGARLSVRVTTGMQEVGDPDEKKLIFVEVVNRGDRLTTLTHLAVYEYASWFNRLRRKSKMAYLVPRPGGGALLPHELEPGKRWTGLLEEGPLRDLLSNERPCLDAVVVHSGSNRDIRVPFSVHHKKKSP